MACDVCAYDYMPLLDELDYVPSRYYAQGPEILEHCQRIAERFELYVRGVEIANGYHELLDPREQESRFVAANEKRKAAGKPELPLDPRLIAALEAGVPECAGVAVGLDRVVMLALGVETIDEVQAFPIDRA